MGVGQTNCASVRPVLQRPQYSVMRHASGLKSAKLQKNKLNLAQQRRLQTPYIRPDQQLPKSWATQSTVSHSSPQGLIRDGKVPELMQLLHQGKVSDKELNAHDESGQSALHTAVAKNHLSLTYELLKAGADPWAMNSKGLTPCHIAASKGYEGLLKILLQQLESEPSISQPPLSAVQIEAKVAALAANQPLDLDALDQVVEELTGMKKECFNDREEIYSYLSHLHSWVGSTLQRSDEGWYGERMLCQRIRSVIQALASEKPIGPDGVTEIGREHYRRLLNSELHGQLESLQAVRRFYNIGGIKDDSLQQRLLLQETNHWFIRILSLTQNQEVTLPLGFPGHAIYANFRLAYNESGVPKHIAMRLDNLGYGYRRTHKNPDSQRVYPFILNVPIDDNVSTQEQFQELLSHMIAHEARIGINDWDTFYAEIFAFHNNLTQTYGEDYIDSLGDSRDSSTKKAQTAGNCVLKNHSAGMMARLGKPLFKWFKEQEVAYILARPENIANQHFITQKETEKNQKILESYFKNLPEESNNLVKFLAKPGRQNIGSTVNPKYLCQLIEQGNIEILDQLLSLGADPNSIDADGHSLLHFSVAMQNQACAQLLLKYGADANYQTPSGLSPLHCTALTQDAGMAKLLIKSGARQGLRDKYGQTAWELGAKKLEINLELLSALDSSKATQQPRVQEAR